MPHLWFLFRHHIFELYLRLLWTKERIQYSHRLLQCNYRKLIRFTMQNSTPAILCTCSYISYVALYAYDLLECHRWLCKGITVPSKERHDFSSHWPSHCILVAFRHPPTSWGSIWLQRTNWLGNVFLQWRHHGCGYKPYTLHIGKHHLWYHIVIQWNLSVTNTSIIKFITCDLFNIML